MERSSVSDLLLLETILPLFRNPPIHHFLDNTIDPTYIVSDYHPSRPNYCTLSALSGTTLSPFPGLWKLPFLLCTYIQVDIEHRYRLVLLLSETIL